MKKVLKVALLIVAIIILVPLILGLFVSKDFAVEREVTIDRPKDRVFDYVKHIRNQNDWGPWFKLDPDMEQNYSGIDGRVGFISAWKGNKDVGAGEQEITKIVEGERVETQLRFTEPWESQSDAYITTEAALEGQTLVKWGFTGRTPYPWNVMTLFMNMDKAVGKDFEEGLNNLKEIMERGADVDTLE